MKKEQERVLKAYGYKVADFVVVKQDAESVTYLHKRLKRKVVCRR